MKGNIVIIIYLGNDELMEMTIGEDYDWYFPEGIRQRVKAFHDQINKEKNTIDQIISKSLQFLTRGKSERHGIRAKVTYEKLSAMRRINPWKIYVKPRGNDNYSLMFPTDLAMYYDGEKWMNNWDNPVETQYMQLIGI